MTPQPSPTNLSDELDSIMLKHMQHTGWNGHLEAEVYQSAKQEIMSAITAAYAEAMNEMLDSIGEHDNIEEWKAGVRLRISRGFTK